MRTLLPFLAAALLAVPASAVPTLSRADFNRLAAQEGLPLFWKPSGDESRPVAAADLQAVGDPAALSRYAAGGALTHEFDAAYARLVDLRRLEAVRKELDQGRPNLVVTDLRQAPAADRELARRIVAAAALIERLYERQTGGARWKDQVKDEASRALYARNQMPWCAAPLTEHDPFCGAVPSLPARKSGAYPEALSQDGKMCDQLRARPDGKALLDPFTVVVEKGGSLAAIPLTEAYGPEMKAVAVELRAAADAQGADEPKLKAYLLGAAKGFETGDWSEADEAWSRMGSRNTKWYLRVAPDEVEFDPCQEKAGFHVSFAKIDQTSLAWQDKLGPIKQEMEDSLASLIGPAYTARKAAFQLPDFIEIVVNAGDSRHAISATIGQSLPNWGKVAEENRRRTVVMTNLYEDPDSKRTAREKAGEMLDAQTLKDWAVDKEPGLVGVILHESAHNLGPHSDSRIGGKKPSEVFGGRLSSTLEEFKAQTAALWYVQLLKRRGLIDDAMARRVLVHELAWCFGHIATGYTTETGAPKPYAQLSAVQIGWLVRAGALTWTAGPDGVERLRADFEKLPSAVESLMKEVGSVYARGDKAAAQALLDEFVSGPGAALVRQRDAAARLSKYPRESYRYTVLD